MTTLSHVHRRPYGVAKFLMKVETVAVTVELAVAEDIFWNGSKTTAILSEDVTLAICRRHTSELRLRQPRYLVALLTTRPEINDAQS